MGDARPYPPTSPDMRRRRRWRRRARVAARRTALMGTGGVLMVAAVAATPTPLPGRGLALLAVAVYFLGRGSKTARRALKWSRRRLPRLSRGLERIKPRLPAGMRRFIDHSAPET